MKTLVLFYSRSGNTQKIANVLAEKLGAEIEEILDKKDRKGLRGFLTGGRDALKKILTEIDEPKKNPADYDLVIIGTPVWAGTMTPAVRTYIERFKKDFKKLAFFTTQGGKDEQKTFKDLESLLGHSFFDKLMVRAKEINKEEFSDKVEKFINCLSEGG